MYGRRNLVAEGIEGLGYGVVEELGGPEGFGA